VALYQLVEPIDAVAPTMVVAFDTWVDAGSAATTAVEQLATDRLAELTWPELTIRHTTILGRELLAFCGPEPDYRWREFAESVADLVERLGVTEWISVGAIPAAVPHTRAVPIIGTASGSAVLTSGVNRGPDGILRVPSAAISVLEMRVAEADVPALGYFAQIPHYVSGPYPAAALELLGVLERHLGVELPTGDLAEESKQLRQRLDLAAAADESTRSYVERLESMVDEARLPAGDELISEIERFLRQQGTQGGDLPN
jgi:PAC2 family